MAKRRGRGEARLGGLEITTGGAAPTTSMIEEFRSLGIDVVHGLGMTETSPVATVSRITPLEAGLDETNTGRTPPAAGQEALRSGDANRG
jgi:acyl-CoA synthetase (AMP-forming)/AMP-acid ligase II